MWRWDRREGAAIFAVAGCTLIHQSRKPLRPVHFRTEGDPFLVQHWCNITGHFIAENSLNCAYFFTATMAKKNPVAIETTGFFRGTPERISPFGDKPRIRGAQQKNLPHGRFFRGTPERISPFGDKPRIRGEQQKNLPHGRFFCGTPERIRTAGLQSRSYQTVKRKR